MFALAVAWGILLATVVLPAPVSADSASNCARLRAGIVEMDAKSSTLPGYLDLRATLGGLYARLCDRPTAARDPEFWYDLDGRNSDRHGAAAGGVLSPLKRWARLPPRATPASAMRGSTGMCPTHGSGNPQGCAALLAYPTSIEEEGAPPLPPIPSCWPASPIRWPSAPIRWPTGDLPDIQGDSLRNRLRRG
jgi:hypothetical protein